ncbi:hypothetical protein ETD86_29640 [Nonomuraea turkmeniaca]|uniref:Uncharacterized protein n=1 Tax=Nonomuraea turkmeniaca TaxID=103838 RepID=A0A5S4FA04_9ACTN|nr:hypothetical protein [Nonomuraea turkmeniaca]TMR13909.1 hypothetical protein ETD86_29640 [Nonomuraea turkmeniaca]
MNELLPVAGATKGSRCPKTLLTADGDSLTVTDKASGHSSRVTPARLYHYSYDQGDSSVQGLAALNADGLVVLDLPGEWHAPHLRSFTRRAGIPLVDAQNKPSDQVRTVLASRAPGWRRVRGLAPASHKKWQKAAAICAGVVGIGLMAYLASVGMWAAWRGVAAIGRAVLDIVDGRWLVVAFSPALLVLRPAMAKLHRWRVNQGSIVGPPDGPYLVGKSPRKLKIVQRNDVLAKFRLGVDSGQAFSLLLYRYDDLTGLVILDSMEAVLHHLPGPWPPNDVDRFAKRHDLFLVVRRLSREEYLTLVKRARTAIP